MSEGLRQFSKYLSNIPQDILNEIMVKNSFNTQDGNFIEFIVVYQGTADEFRADAESIGVKFDDLDYGFGIVTMKVSEINKLDNLTRIQYVELPKVLETTDYQSNSASCVQSAWNTYGLSGEGTIIGFLDTGIDFTHPGFISNDGETRLQYIYDLQTDKIYNRDDINRALSTQLMKGVKFLIDKGYELNKPLIINISLSTNQGGHNGRSLLEQYIEIVSTVEKVTIVIAAGNEGSAGHHVGGEVQQIVRIPLSIADEEKSISIQFYKTLLNSFSIEIISPAGISSQEIILDQRYNERFLGRVKVATYNMGASPIDVIGQIYIRLTTSDVQLISGEWTIILRSLNEYEGYYDMWLPVAEGLNPQTKFLQPSISNTLGIPATVDGVISVGSYSYINNTLSPFSGRGVKRPGRDRKPDILAPGENILSTIVGGGFDTKTGTSMAAPTVAGVCGLLCEWGIVKDNDIYLYSGRLKYYLCRSAKRPINNLNYPDIAYGYGLVCVDNVVNLIQSE